MTPLTHELTSSFSIRIESANQRLRLVVLKDDCEFICRKESLKNLKGFLSGDTDRLFKGRLQLHRSADEILVEAKKEVIGKINAEDFQRLLAVNPE